MRQPPLLFLALEKASWRPPTPPDLSRYSTIDLDTETTGVSWATAVERARHLREAVLNSITALFDYIRAKTLVHDDGDKLIGRVFSVDKPVLVLSELQTESGQNDQKGFMQIFKGAYQGIRNPKAHSMTHDLTQPKAAQYLIFASLLARRVEEAQKVK